MAGHPHTSPQAHHPCNTFQPHLRRRFMAGHSHTSMLPSSPPSASRRPSLLKDMPLTGPMPRVASLNSPVERRDKAGSECVVWAVRCHSPSYQTCLAGS